MIIRSVRHGYLTATNGPDTMTAEYERGLKFQDGYRPHWNIMLNGHVLEPVYGGRTDVEAMMERLLVLPSPSPMEVGQANAMFSATGMVRGILCIPLKDLMTLSAGEKLASLNRMLTPVRLWNIQCHAVGTSEDGNSVYIRISGGLRPSIRNYKMSP